MTRIWLVTILVGLATNTQALELPRYIGNHSCSTSTCHGGTVDRGPVWNQAFSIWLAKDPHADAGRLLRDKDSQAIVHRLDPSATESRQAYDTALRKWCISCHTTATAEQTSTMGQLPDKFLADGVSCESCHGPAERWQSSHTRADWNPGEDTSLRENRSIIERAETCVRCHIGSRTDDGLIRDMNHDLIAAGHPSLRFDLSIYLANLPKHWDQNDAHEIEFYQSIVRIRSVSRAVNLAAAAELSSERATDHLRDPSVPWPELSDYDCFACHQSLSMDEFRLPPSGKKKSPLHVSAGLPVWNSWHTVNQLQVRDNPTLLEKLSPSKSDPAQIATSGKSLAVKYRKIAEQRLAMPVNPRGDLEGMFAKLSQRPPPADWHQAAIEFLEFDALCRDLDHSTSEPLKNLERLLRFDPDLDAGQIASVHSPTQFDPEAFRRTILQALQTTLEKP